ncbi:MAG: phage tail protein, partial [Chloroflexota bacterium]|nr:phage tail protein [Chloroflexota bacterium]
LQVETEIFEYREGGRNDFVHQLAGPSRVGNITLKCGMAADANEFVRWYMDVVQGKIKRRNVSVIIYNASGGVMTRWHFPRAYPVRWIAPVLNADSSGAAIETLELAHAGLQPE